MSGLTYCPSRLNPQRFCDRSLFLPSTLLIARRHCGVGSEPRSKYRHIYRQSESKSGIIIRSSLPAALRAFCGVAFSSLSTYQ